MKHISKTVLLLALLAAVTVLAGCTKDAEIPTSPSPGTWENVQDIPTFPEDPEECFFYSSDGKTVTFHFDSSDRVESFDNFDDKIGSISANSYNWALEAPFSLVSYTGFEAIVKKTSGNNAAGYGFLFNCLVTQEEVIKSFFILELSNSHYRIYCVYRDSQNQQQTVYFTESPDYWVSNPHINPVGTENKVKIFTKTNGNIALYINDYLLQEITPPSGYITYEDSICSADPTIKKDVVFVNSGIHHDDYYGNADSEVVIKFKFNKLQTQP